MNLLALPPPSNGAPSSSRCAVSERQPIQSIAPLVEPGQLMDDGWLVGYGPPRPALKTINSQRELVGLALPSFHQNIFEWNEWRRRGEEKKSTLLFLNHSLKRMMEERVDFSSFNELNCFSKRR